MENSTHRQHLPPASRCTAGALGFLNLSLRRALEKCQIHKELLAFERIEAVRRDARTD